MPVSHVVLAGEEWLPIAQADSPVELGREVLLGNHQFRTFEELFHPFAQRAFVGTLHNPLRERRVGLLEHHGKAQRPPHLVDVLAVHDHGPRGGHLVPRQQFGQVDLVRALQDRFGVIHHHQPLGGSPPGEAVGVMVDLRGLANKERVELGDAGVVVAPHNLGPQPHRVRRLDKLVDRPPIRRGQLVVGVVEDRQVVLGRDPFADRAPSAGEVLGRLGDHERVMRLRDFSQRNGAQLSQLPAAVSPFEVGSQQRGLEEIEQVQGQAVVALGQVSPEVDREGEFGRLDRGERRLDEFVEVVRHEPHHRLRLHVLDRGDVRTRTMSAGLRQQRHVVPGGLVAIAAAEVEQLHPPQRPKPGLGQVRPGVGHLDPRNVEFPLRDVIDDDECGHGVEFGRNGGVQ